MLYSNSRMQFTFIKCVEKQIGFSTAIMLTICLALVFLPLDIQAGTLSPSFTDFEEGGFVAGTSVNDTNPVGTFVNITNVNNCLQAWRVGNAGPTAEDEEIVDLGADGKVWRLSQGTSMGSLGSAPQAPNNGNVTPLTAGELNPAGAHVVHNDAGCGAPTTANFYGEVDFKSVTGAPVAMSLSVVASSGDQRHGYVQILDDGVGSGLDIGFYDTVGTAFNYTILDLNLSYTDWHKIGIEILFVDNLASGVLGDANAVGNDIVNIYVDGTLVHTGTSWESYYASLADDTRRIQSVDRLMFSGAVIPAQLNGGLYFDNVLVTDHCPAGNCNMPPTFSSVGECISTSMADNCTGLTGKDRAACNHEQQAICFELFGVK